MRSGPVAKVIFSIVLTGGLAACGGGGGKAAATTTTVPPQTTTTIPAPSLSADPATGAAGSTFTLKGAAFKPGENVTLEVKSPDGKSTKGQPHAVAQDGTFSATFKPTSAGTYTVNGTGDQGESASMTFDVTGSASSGKTGTTKRTTATTAKTTTTAKSASSSTTTVAKSSTTATTKPAMTTTTKP